jgi:hypothetical protein
MMSWPNIVVLIAHDLGSHVGPYGVAKRQTPHLINLASEGCIRTIVFRQRRCFLR